MERIKINLDLTPEERWKFLKKYNQEVNELIKYYLSDLGDVGMFKEFIDHYKLVNISKSYQDEIKVVSRETLFSENDVLITNLYYDALKMVFGCTAFCSMNNNELLHARNLDWWSEKNILGDYTKIFDFEKNGKIVYSTIGWPGFIGALSGVKKGAFSITLNAVLSNESPQFATPITFLIRDVLENVSNFDDAVNILSKTIIASDCLIMVVGCKKNECVVIERTPTRFAIRKSTNSCLIVTNEYLSLLENRLTNDTLQLTASSRYERVRELISQKSPKSISDHFNILSDSKIQMGITVQQMVLNPNTGEINLKTK